MITRWHKAQWPLSPLRRIATLREELDNLFTHAFRPSYGSSADLPNQWLPPVDIYEEKDHLTVHVELPGLKKEDIDISLQDGSLTISGERKHENTQKPYRSERFLGRFQRTVNLPCKVNAEKIEATYTDGILVVRLPKAEEAKPKQIPVNINN